MKIFQIKRRKCSIAMCRRKEEYERLGLVRYVLKLPKDLRYCDKHEMEIKKVKVHITIVLMEKNTC